MPPLTFHECKKLAELIEGQHMADFFRAASPDFIEEHGLYVEEASSYIATIEKKSEDFTTYNRVFALGIASPATEATIEHLVELYSQAGLPFVIPLSPEAQPAELSRWLNARGSKTSMRTARFFKLLDERMLDEPIGIAHHFRILPVSAKYASQFAYIACREHSPVLQKWLLSMLGRPGWHHYIAMDDETPIATGILFVQGKVGWLGWAATLPFHRRQGAHISLLAHRISEARRLGCTLLSAETREDTLKEPNPSYHNLQRAGFQFAYLRTHYIFKSPSLS